MRHQRASSVAAKQCLRNGRRALRFESLEPRQMLDAASLIISEFMALNKSFVRDNYNEYSDWVEIHNPTDTAIALDGWYLTDKAGNLTQWQFPDPTSGNDLVLAPGGYLVVWASGRNLTNLASPLHTNFKLDGDGEFLALVMPDGVTVAHSYTPKFPGQLDNISYGILSSALTWQDLIVADSTVAVLVPSDGSLGTTWTQPEFDDSAWLLGFNGVGYDVGTPGSGYAPLIGTDLAGLMPGHGSSAYVRIAFDLPQTPAYLKLELRLQYDDGCVVYLNGQKIVERNAPASPQFDSFATAAHDGLIVETIDLSPYRHLLRQGVNVLAVHALVAEGSGDEMLVLPTLRGQAVVMGETQYFTTPTPGSANVPGAMGTVAAPTASVPRGFYDQPLSVSLSVATPGAQIRYTLDGSKPTATNGLIYTGTPITINTTSTLRFAAFKPGYLASDVETHTYIFLNDVLRQTRPAGYPTTRSGIPLWYGMTPEIVDNPVYADRMLDSLTALPTLSLVLPFADFFGPNGIYMNPLQSGFDWERETSAELILPDGSTAFQIDAGLRIQGNASRQPSNSPKQSMSLRFRAEYGNGNLNYPLFPDSPVTSFDVLQLRAGYNNTWIHWDEKQRLRGQLIHDQWARDAFLAMGHEDAGRGRFVHVYVNGLYWGVFMVQEMQEASHYAAYHGIDASQVDAVNGGKLTDGTLTAWNNMKAVVASKDWAAIQNVLDVDNFIDFTILQRYAGNQDLKFDGNWRAAGGGPNNLPWRFYFWDTERILEDVANTNRPQANTDPYGDPVQLMIYLQDIPEFRMRFADRLQKHLVAPGGALTPAVTAALYQQRAQELDRAIIAESARWGTYRRDIHYRGEATLYQRDTHWVAERDKLLNTYFPARTTNIINRYRSDGWFPSINAPVFSQHGGQVAYGYGLSLSGSGVIYYTLDGSDPRLPGGAVSPTALVFNPNTTNVTLVAANSVWKFLDNGSDQGTAWYAPAFNDSGWNSGPGVFGYGRSGISTTISFGSDSNNKYVTTYFRREFDVEDPERLLSLLLEVMRDDGVVVYLNGVEVARSNMPAGTINYVTFASATVGDETTYHPIDLTAYRHLLVDGRNVLAVELHQINRTTSDARFDARLTAVRAADVIRLYSSGPVRTRSLSGGTWSALNEAMFYVGAPAAAGNLAITELNYNPYAPTAAEQAAGFTDAQQFEYVELRNIGPTTIDLTGVRFTEGISFDFTGSAITALAPGQYVLVARNPAAFALRYGGGLPVAGAYSGALDNSGERVTLTDRFDQPIVSLRYRRDQGWPWRPNGIGSTLEIVDPAAAADNAANWRASTEYGGTPGAAGAGPIVSLVVNEVLTHTDLPQVDAIELYNPTSAAINVAGWWLSDSRGNLFKYRFPVDTPSWTTIEPGGYLVIDESHFNPDPLNPPSWAFSLSSLGEEVWLVSADASGRPLAFVDFVEFGAAANGESFGRWPNGAGGLYPMRSVTLGSANSGPRVGPVVISELHYAPTAPTAAELALAPTMTANDFEFIELYNPTSSSVDLSGWQFRQGVTYECAAGTTIAAGGTLVILPFDPRTDGAKWSAFSLRYFGSAAAAVPANFVGGWTGVLDNAGEAVGLYWPDEPPAENPTIIPWILMDRLSYLPSEPWPAASGVSLSRRDPGGWGEDPGSWTAAAASPGSVGYYATLVSAEAFYGGSRGDGALPSAAPIEVLWPGGAAASGNYGNYSGGLNGLRLRFEGLPEGAALSADSFAFRWGNSGAVESWAEGPALQSVTMQPGGWAVLRFGADAVRNGWLEVRVLADASTRLATDVVFYVGNLVGDVNGDFAVTAADAAAIQAAASPLQAVAGSARVFDINGDGVVNATDVLLARRNAGTVLTALSAPLPSGPLWAGGAIPLAETMPLTGATRLAETTLLAETFAGAAFSAGPSLLAEADPQAETIPLAAAMPLTDAMPLAETPTALLGMGDGAAGARRATAIVPLDDGPAFAAAWTDAVWTTPASPVAARIAPVWMTPAWTARSDSAFALNGAASSFFDGVRPSGRLGQERSAVLSADTDWLASLRSDGLSATPKAAVSIRTAVVPSPAVWYESAAADREESGLGFAMARWSEVEESVWLAARARLLSPIREPHPRREVSLTLSVPLHPGLSVSRQEF